MTTAEVRSHPGCLVTSTYLSYGSNTLNVNDSGREQQEDAMYTSAEVLEAVLAAYECGYNAGRAQARREHWNSTATTTPLRLARASADSAAMWRRARATYEARGLPAGYNYRGGPVDWITGMPEGSGCAWLRRMRMTSTYELAGGSR
jgi:hypothetical protein